MLIDIFDKQIKKINNMKKIYLGILGLSIISILGLFGCNSNNPQPINQTYSVKYVVNCPECDIDYWNEYQGVSEVNNQPGLWELNLTLKSKNLAYVNARLSNGSASGNILTKIFVNGVLESESTGSGTGAMATSTYNLP
jgi:hypothetical protein